MNTLYHPEEKGSSKRDNRKVNSFAKSRLSRHHAHNILVSKLVRSEVEMVDALENEDNLMMKRPLLFNYL